MDRDGRLVPKIGGPAILAKCSNATPHSENAVTQPWFSSMLYNIFSQAFKPVSYKDLPKSESFS